MIKKLIFLLLVFHGNAIAQNASLLLTEIKSIDSKRVIDRFVYSGIQNDDKEVKSLKRKAEFLIQQTIKNKEYDNTYYLSNLLFLFHTKPLKEDSCIYYLNLQKMAKEALKNDSLDARLLKNKAYLYGVQNKPEEEMEYLLKAASAFEKNGDKEGLTICYMNLAVLFSKRNELSKRQAYENKALAISKTLPNRVIYDQISINQCFRLVYTKPDSVILVAQNIILKNKEENIQYQKGQAFHLLSMAYLQKKNYLKALAYADTVQRFYGKEVHKGILINSFFDKSEALFNLGKNQSALQAAAQSMALAKENKAYYSIYALHEHIGNIYAEKGDFKSALYHKDLSNYLKDSLYSIEKTMAIRELETRFETAKKERDIARLNKEKMEQANKFQTKVFIISAISIFLLALTVISTLYLRNKALKSKNYSMNLERRLFKSQIDPHFAFNTLSSIQAHFLEENSGKEAALYLSKFSKMMRAIFKSNNERFNSLTEELSLLKNYLELQRLRYKEQFDFNLDFEENLGEIWIPPMLIQPLIENAIKHGKIYERNQGYINVSFRILDSKRLEVSIVDNGFGFPKEVSSTANGISTQLIKDQLDIFKKEFKDDFFLEIKESSAAGVVSHIILPYFRKA